MGSRADCFGLPQALATGSCYHGGGYGVPELSRPYRDRAGSAGCLHQGGRKPPSALSCLLRQHSPGAQLGLAWVGVGMGANNVAGQPVPEDVAPFLGRISEGSRESHGAGGAQHCQDPG